MKVMVDSLDVDFGLPGGPRNFKVFWREVIFAVLITKLEVGIILLLIPHDALFFGQAILIGQVVTTLIVRAFIDGEMFALFPFIESVRAMRAAVFGFTCSLGSIKGTGFATDFTFRLRGDFAVIEV